MGEKPIKNQIRTSHNNNEVIEPKEKKAFPFNSPPFMHHHIQNQNQDPYQQNFQHNQPPTQIYDKPIYSDRNMYQQQPPTQQIYDNRPINTHQYNQQQQPQPQYQLPHGMGYNYAGYGDYSNFSNNDQGFGGCHSRPKHN